MQNVLCGLRCSFIFSRISHLFWEWDDSVIPQPFAAPSVQYKRCFSCCVNSAGPSTLSTCVIIVVARGRQGFNQFFEIFFFYSKSKLEEIIYSEATEISWHFLCNVQHLVVSSGIAPGCYKCLIHLCGFTIINSK